METLITKLQELVGTDSVLTGEAVKERVCHVWHAGEPLQAKAVVLPRSTAEVAAVLKACHTCGQPVVVHGGLTNLVGSTETHEGEVVIAMEKMNRIEEVDEKSRTVTVQAGAVLEHVQQAAADKNLLLPLTFGAKGSAQIGGALSTNAGGLRVFRYGLTRSLVLGLEAVLADGTMISSMKKIIKDNSAYDIKQLFIGSEGTLGVITRAVLKLVEAPKSRNSVFVGLNDYEKVVELLKYMDAGLAGTLSGFELIWGESYRTMTSPPALPNPPLPHGYKYYVLLESLGSHQEQDALRLQELMEEAFEKGMVLDAAFAENASQLDWFWNIRENVEVLASQANHEQHFDISLPIPHIGTFIDSLLQKLYKIPKVEKVFPFGHVADGNIHLIIGKSEQSEALIRQINETIYLPLQTLGGSVSAEHGIGLHKKAYLSLVRTPEEIQLMKTLKQTLDPNNILNRGKVLDM